jgi:transcription elongation GreA/GreB family factor
MNYIYTKEGLEAKKRDIKLQEDKVEKLGKEVGEEAGTNCDWHDNFGYEEAKRKLDIENESLQNLKNEVENAKIIDIKEQNILVEIGVTVNVLVDDVKKEFTIGAYNESNPKLGLVSYLSPLSQALINMKVGEEKNVNLAGKMVNVKILKIDAPSIKYVNLISKLFKK